MNENSIQQPESNSMGAVLGSIIVIIILLVAAFYLWGNRPAPAPVEDIGVTADEVLGTQDPQTASLQAQSDADNLGAIDADLKNTDVNNLTPEVDSIGQEVTPAAPAAQ